MDSDLNNNDLPKKRKHKEKEVREIIVDPAIIQAMKEMILKTGENPISTAPDPKEQNQPKDSALEALPFKQEEKKKPVKVEPEPNSFFSCCSQGAAKVEEDDELLPDVIPTSEYSDEYQNLLPPQAEEDIGKITLVLDLDETLVHSSFTKNPKADFRFNIGLDEAEINVWVAVRPFCEEFLRAVGPLFEVVLFTASTKYYADIVVNEIDKTRSIKYRLYRESCSNVGGCRVKDLSLIGRDLKRTIIIDNSSVAYLLHPYNAIAITSWYDDKNDKELNTISNVLTKCYRISRVYEILCDL